MELLGRIIFVLPLAMMGMGHFFMYKSMLPYAESKKLPMANISVLVSGGVLVLGLLGFIFNFQTKIAGWLVVAFLLGAAFFMHAFWKEEDFNMKNIEMSQFMKNMALAGATIAMIYAF